MIEVTIRNLLYKKNVCYGKCYVTSSFCGHTYFMWITKQKYQQLLVFSFPVNPLNVLNIKLKMDLDLS